MNRKKRRIFNTAIKLFSEKGYENTSIEEITAVAGVAKGSLYYHFPTKEDVFDFLVDNAAKLLSNSIEIKCRNCNNALEKLQAIMMVQIKSIIRYEDFLVVVLNHILGETPRSKRCQKELYNYIEKIEDIIKEGIEEGIFYEGDPEALASGIFGVTFSSLLYRLKKDRKVDAQQIYDGYIKTVIRGITKN